MKFSECIGILLLIVVNHQVLAHGGGSCGENKYLHNGHCCNLCPAGTHLVTDCTQSSDTICKPCDGGQYTAYPNRLQRCLMCKHCDGHVGLVVKPEGACVPTKNTECQCREGMYHPLESSLVCVNHSLCRKGEEVANKGTSVSDTVCQPCPYGTFSNRESLTKCKPWRNCTAKGMKTVRNGTSTRNARCEQLPTTSTEKLPVSSGTVTHAPMMVKSTTVNMKKTTAKSASTTTTAPYRSTKAFQVTAAPTSTRRSHTTPEKSLTTQQTIDEVPDNIPYITQVTMPGTPPSDSIPKDGGDGPNHHGNKAQVATSVVVGLIAFLILVIVLCLLGTACYLRKWRQRQRWQRRPRYRSFPLPADEDLQPHDLERQLPKDTDCRAGHATRTSTLGATPGDNTSSHDHEIESLIQSEEGTSPHDSMMETKGAERLPAIPITDEHLVKLAKKMPESWKAIGMEHFQITVPDLDRFRTKHMYDRDMQIVEMFRFWVRGQGKAAKLCNLCQKLNVAGIERKVLYELFSEEETKTKTLVD